MVAKAQVAVEDYVRASFDGPDREYVDGEIIERNVDNKQHSKVQGNLTGFFYSQKERCGFHVLPELRLQLAPARYRIPDLAIYAGEEPSELVPTAPPLIAVEILSPEDRMDEVMAKLEEYRSWGVEHVWLVNAERGSLYVYGDGNLEQVEAFRLDKFDVTIPASKIV